MGLALPKAGLGWVLQRLRLTNVAFVFGTVYLLICLLTLQHSVVGLTVALAIASAIVGAIAVTFT